MILSEFMEGNKKADVCKENDKFIVNYYLNNELVKTKPAYDEEDAEILAEDWVLWAIITKLVKVICIDQLIKRSLIKTLIRFLVIALRIKNYLNLICMNTSWINLQGRLFVLLNNFYGVSLPITTKDIEFIERRNIKVQFLKRQLGSKYVLFNLTTKENKDG